jgi:hypothetical protein
MKAISDESKQLIHLNQLQAMLYGQIMNIATKFNTRVYLNSRGTCCVRRDIYEGLRKILDKKLFCYLSSVIPDENGIT